MLELFFDAGFLIGLGVGILGTLLLDDRLIRPLARWLAGHARSR